MTNTLSGLIRGIVESKITVAAMTTLKVLDYKLQTILPGV